MLNVLDWGAWLLAGILSVVILYLTLELGVGLARSDKRRLISSPLQRTGAILVPAHNEAVSIVGTVEALRVSAPNCRILVVADNCSDDTAELARAAGADVIVRNSVTHKGKGFALAFGRDYLAKSPPEAVIIIDADCKLSPGGADILIARAIQNDQPVQGAYFLATDPGDSSLTRISNFAMLVKNLVRARGLERISGGTLLFGSGMAFPWHLFATLNLATSHAVEDLELGLLLARQGIRVSFENGAIITSPAVSGEASIGQRSRWEHGFMQTAQNSGLPMLWSGLSSASRHLFFIGAHMMVPPLAVLMLISFAAALLLAMLFGMGAISMAPLLLLSVCFIFLSAALLTAWWREGREVISGRALLTIPFYVLWKLPIYLRFFTARQTAWNRTKRDGEDP